jgi:hypothetical protein
MLYEAEPPTALAEERRRFPRLEAGYVMHVACRDPFDAEPVPVSVVTVNISAGGALFQTPRWRQFPVGGRVHLTVFLPPALSGAGWHSSRLSGKGTVTRHDVPEGAVESDWRGVAVSFDRPMALG